eukprot:4115928-Alexandrium_andersonii.AAC.1
MDAEMHEEVQGPVPVALRKAVLGLVGGTLHEAAPRPIAEGRREAVDVAEGAALRETVLGQMAIALPGAVHIL